MSAKWPPEHRVLVESTEGDLAVNGGLGIQPRTGGLFHDFSTGAPGVAIQGKERPCPNYVDFVTVAAGASLVYAAAADVPLAGIPAWAKITTTLAAASNFTFSDTSFQDRPVSYGRVYLHFPVALPQFVFALINTGGPQIKLRLNTASTISVLDNSNVVKSTSAVALAAGTAYRVEWRVTCTPAGTATVDVYLYTGHGTIPIDTFSTPVAFTAGPLVTSASLGDFGANFTGRSLYLGAVAVNCETLPGPYMRQENAQAMVAPDGRTRFEFDPNGELVIRAHRDYQIADGGTEHYLIQEGDIVGRLGNDGLYLGPTIGMGDPADLQDDQLHDLTLDTKNRRVAGRGMNIYTLNDPPDFAYHAMFLIPAPSGDANYGATGTGAATVAGSPAVTFTDLTLIMRNRGHGLVIDGNSYNIAEITGPNSCTVKPTPAANGSGLTWKLKSFPYPLASQLSGMNFGRILAQPCRVVPMAHAPIGSGTSGVNTSAGSAVVDITALSAPNKALWTVGRRVLINDDVSLMAAAPGRCFHILSVAGDGNSVTLDAPVPAALTNVKWKLASANTDGYAQKVLHPILTEVFNAETDCVNFSTTLGIGAAKKIISAIRADQLWNSSGGQAHDLFVWSTDGWNYITEGGIDAPAFKAGGAQFRPYEAMAVVSRGLIAETGTLQACSAFGTPTNQAILGGLIGLPVGETITYLLIAVEVAGAGTPPTTLELALIGPTGQVRRTTGNIAADAQLTSTGLKAFALASPYTITLTPGMHYLALLKNGAFTGTDIQLVRVGGLASAMTPYGSSARPGFRWSPRTAYPGGSVTMATMQANELYWMGCA